MKDKGYKMMQKDEYRALAKKARAEIGQEKLLIKSKSIEEKIRGLDIYKRSLTVMSYLAKDIEISLSRLFEDKTKKWFLPIVETLHATSLRAVPYEHGKTKLIKNKFDILEPVANEDEIFKARFDNLAFDLIFVPGLCFDKNGNRIGFGKGYYDSFLKLNPDSFKIGCCPKECFFDELPVDAWDVGVDLVITD